MIRYSATFSDLPRGKVEAEKSFLFLFLSFFFDLLRWLKEESRKEIEKRGNEKRKHTHINKSVATKGRNHRNTKHLSALQQNNHRTTIANPRTTCIGGHHGRSS